MESGVELRVECSRNVPPTRWVHGKGLKNKHPEQMVNLLYEISIVKNVLVSSIMIYQLVPGSPEDHSEHPEDLMDEPKHHRLY